MVRESRHLWVGNLPETVHEEQIGDYFKRYGRVEKVKLLPKQSADGGKAAFVDFVDIRAANKANDATNRMGDRELRTNYNEPGNPGVIGERAKIGGDRGERRPPGGYDRGSTDEFGRDRPTSYGADNDMPGSSRGRLQYRDEKQAAQPSRQKFPRVTPDSSDSDKSGSDSSDNGDNSHSDSGESNSDSGSDDDTPPKPSRAGALCVKNLSTRTSDHSLQEALFHEFKKAGDIIYIRVFKSGEQRYAVVKFRNGADAEKAMVHHTGKMFLGQEMKLLPWKLDEKESERLSPAPRSRSKPKHYGNAVEELGYDPQATRTLFVGNLEKTLSHGELKKSFDKFGDIVDVDIKKQDRGVTTYAFIQFIDVGGAMRGKKRMDRQFVGRNRVKVGYGRGTPTNTIWVGNLPSNTSDSQLQRQFNAFGFISKIMIDREFLQALIWFETIDSATAAFNQTRGKFIHGKRLTVDFASRSCKEGFYARMEQSGQLDRRNLEPSPPPRPSYGNSGGSAGRTGFNRRSGGDRQEFRSSRSDFGNRLGRSGSMERGYGSASGRGDSIYNEGSGNGGSGYANAMPDDDYDDYERELRDYGYRQKERERERVRKPERDTGDRGYSPLSEEDQLRPPPSRPVRDSRSPPSGRADDGSYVSDREMRPSSRRAGMKRKHVEEDPYMSPSPLHVESVVMKVDRVRRKKKDKIAKKKSRMGLTEAEEAELVGGGSNEEMDDEMAAEQQRIAKLEQRAKRKRRMALEKAEEKARRKELKRLKKLKKLRNSEGYMAQGDGGIEKDPHLDHDTGSAGDMEVPPGDDVLSDAPLSDKQQPLALSKDKEDTATESDSVGFPLGKEEEPAELKADDEQTDAVILETVPTEGEGGTPRTPLETPASPTFDGDLRTKECSISPVLDDEEPLKQTSDEPKEEGIEETAKLQSAPMSPRQPSPRSPATPNLEEDHYLQERSDDAVNLRRRGSDKGYGGQHRKDGDEMEEREAYFSRSQRREKGPKTPPAHSDELPRAESPEAKDAPRSRDRRIGSKDSYMNKYDSKKRDDGNFRDMRSESGRDARSESGREGRGYSRTAGSGGSDYREEWRDRPSRDQPRDASKRDRMVDRYEAKPTRERDDRQPSTRERMRYRRSPSPRASDPRQRNSSPLPSRYRGSDVMEKRPRSPLPTHKVIHSPDYMRNRDSPEKSRYDKRIRGRQGSPFNSDKDRDTRQKGYAHHHGQPRAPIDNHDTRDRRDYSHRHDRNAGGARDDSPPPPPPPPPSTHELQPSAPAPVAAMPAHHHHHHPAGHQPPSSGAIPYHMGGTAPQTSLPAAPHQAPSNAYTLLDLLRRYPVMWQGLFALKHNSAAIQMHYLSGNVRIAEASLPRGNQPGEVPPPLTISQRMKLEPSQLEGVNKRIQVPKDHCLLLALPCGRDPLDVHAQTRALKSGFISYLQEKQAAGIINVNSPATKQPAYVLHIFPPCDFAQTHLAKVAPDLLDSAADSGHLMVLVTTV